MSFNLEKVEVWVVEWPRRVPGNVLGKKDQLFRVPTLKPSEKALRTLAVPECMEVCRMAMSLPFSSRCSVLGENLVKVTHPNLLGNVHKEVSSQWKLGLYELSYFFQF